MRTQRIAAGHRRLGRETVRALAAAVLLTGFVIRAGAQLPAPVAEALSQAGIPHSAVGVYVYDLTARKPLLAYGADRALNPASSIKLVTTFAALEVLGPAHVWRTEAWMDGSLNGDRLEGNLYFKGYGNPKLTLESLWLFLREIRNRGVREISGDLVLDRTYFTVEAHDPASFDNEPLRPYNVGPDALLFNFKSFRLQFVPDEVRGVVSLYAEPPLPQVSIVNNLVLGVGPCDLWPDKPLVEENRLTFSGVFPANCGEKAKHYSLLAPHEYFGAVFRQLWEGLEGSLAGQVVDGVLPPSARLLAANESPPLADVIRDINKYSHNVMARHVFLSLGAAEGAPLTTEKAERAMQAWMSSRNFAFPELVLDNGSGLSRSARITARHLTEVLIAAWHSPLMPEFVASLPLVAHDGTMRRRLPDSPVAGRAHIKTGYLENVRSIAGYVQDESGSTLAAVLMINHPSAKYAAAAQDAMLEWLHARPNNGCCRRHRAN
jgi:D-alanyl-D-alanine carboxypeptidase/D-alanyl-D-alanine-endopeptidase (penicillin-binding protein 4)